MEKVMSITRMIAILLTIAAVSLALVVPAPAADQASAKGGPDIGKWEFTGKDSTGKVWSGTLTIEKVDPAKWDANKYHSLGRFEVQVSNQQTKDVQLLGEWDPGTRTISFGKTYPAIHVYTAVLSGDGKVLTQGKWTESKMVRGQPAGVVESGEWSAKLSNR
jgi:hypothetical protein